MAKRRLCSQCGEYNAFSAKECKDCGVVFTAHGETKRTTPTACSFSAEGRDCEHRGVLSAGTNGDTSWYCREHWDVLNGRVPFGRGNALPPMKAGPSERVEGYSWDNERKRYVLTQERAA